MNWADKLISGATTLAHKADERVTEIERKAIGAIVVAAIVGGFLGAFFGRRASK